MNNSCQAEELSQVRKQELWNAGRAITNEIKPLLLLVTLNLPDDLKDSEATVQVTAVSLKHGKI